MNILITSSPAVVDLGTHAFTPTDTPPIVMANDISPTAAIATQAIQTQIGAINAATGAKYVITSVNGTTTDFWFTIQDMRTQSTALPVNF